MNKKFSDFGNMPLEQCVKGFSYYPYNNPTQFCYIGAIYKTLTGNHSSLDDEDLDKTLLTQGMDLESKINLKLLGSEADNFKVKSISVGSYIIYLNDTLELKFPEIAERLKKIGF